MREGVCTVDVERCLDSMLTLGEIVAGDNVGSERADRRLVAVNRNRVKRRTVLVESDLDAVSFNFVFDIKLIGQLAAVEGKSLLGDRCKSDRFGQLDDRLLHTVDAYAEVTEKIAPFGCGSVSERLNDNEL